jgi:hypothetical protein
MGDASQKWSNFADMFVRKKKNRSGMTSIVVVDKSGSKFRELKTIGVSSEDKEIFELEQQGKKWIATWRTGCFQ